MEKFSTRCLLLLVSVFSAGSYLYLSYRSAQVAAVEEVAAAAGEPMSGGLSLPDVQLIEGVIQTLLQLLPAY
ncbi:MAG: hypothetical protein J5W83_02805 [Candidatus Accumulibacter sp.]|uniref:hypothetical protein n=1 Tax=Accumulibacter sp. TaxID=2053492 RepID=UPI001B05B6FA|nr:hypothetical protein [Accumulibacter sp.]MBO3701461.1 hypothetical protein [Accumulibacter sp.]